MAGFSTGTYQPKNGKKYIGGHFPKWRSGWELTVMRTFDNHPNVVAWASENHKIPYIHPITGKKANYIPDFFVLYVDANGKQHAEIVEVKPSNQILGEAKSQYDKLQAVVNHAKWEAARAYCKHHGVSFRIITEKDIFNKPKKAVNTRRPRKPKK